MIQPLFLDMRVLGIIAATSLATAVIFGLYPAFDAARARLRLASAGRATQGPRRAFARRAMIVTEVALSTVLLIAAGLVARTLILLAGLNPGFDGRSVLTASLSLQDARYSTVAQVNRLFEQSLQTLRESPGVEAAGVGLTLPYERALNEGARVMDGPHAMQQAQTTNVTYITPGYLEALRIALLRGRAFHNGDTATSQPVAMVNSAYVRRYLRDSEPLGKHIALGGGPPVEIVGVVADVQEKRAGWGDFGPIGAIFDVYVPATQFSEGGFRTVHTWFMPKWVVRSSAPRLQISSALQQSVASVDPGLPFAEFRSMDEVRSAAFGMQRLETMLLSALSGLALLLAAVGVYGIIAHSVVERTREFGIRLALGSTRWRVIGSAACSGIWTALIGTAAGVATSLWTGKLMTALIWGVKPSDGYTLSAVTAILLIVAALASFIPALRIARIDPAVTLREE